MKYELHDKNGILLGYVYGRVIDMTEHQKRRKELESAIHEYLVQHRLIVKGSKINIPQGNYSYEAGLNNGQLWTGNFQLDDSDIKGTFQAQFDAKDERYFYVFHRPAYSLNITFNKKDYSVRG